MKWYKSLNYPRWAIINFIVLSIFGVLLRYMQLYDVPKLDYQFILHAHSHFAFSGWMFFSIALLIASLCNEGKIGSGFKAILLLTLISAYGMLASFSWQGYKLVSISFSTLFVLVTFRFTYLVSHGNLLKKRVNEPAYILLRGSLFLLCLSALGPFALGPLAALGLKNTPYYQDAIYFYLHFQMNGFMLLAVLGLLVAAFPITPLRRRSRLWLYVFVFSAVPLYFIFSLWSNPGRVIWILAAISAGLNLASWLVLCFSFRSQWRNLSFIERAAFIGLTLKCVFQVFVCIPAIGDWTFLNRNLIIGYIHLLTLGIIMPLLIGQFLRKGMIRSCKLVATVNILYVILAVTYLCLLFLQPLLALFAIVIPSYQFLLFLLCLSFLPVGILLLFKAKRQRS
ncbi:hypothetical protein CKK33_04070 [Mucilaginibacter sp. MD40]|uniref:hypothetical protein n=1 Tax=Mucilaginibacter sp. MD40 TaxID=2029590 RepID=UPI000BACA4B8|nr:hypothetical protein [Mucilaginibacter sp. MD40]PAW92715.1 hypothetical protein CKK33_04070 [Mucilaginibacter sp. MD40]